MAQQTAVECFAKQAENILIDFAKNNSPFQLELCLHALNDLEVRAKEMEKQQIEDAFQYGKWNGYESAKSISETKDPTDFYNETYGK